jgi:hypothetical protein
MSFRSIHLYISFSGKADRESRNAALGCHLNVTLMGVNNGLDDSQPQTGPFALALTRRIHPVEAVEKSGQMLSGYIRPGIFYAQ